MALRDLKLFRWCGSGFFTRLNGSEDSLDVINYWNTSRRPLQSGSVSISRVSITESRSGVIYVIITSKAASCWRLESSDLIGLTQMSGSGSPNLFFFSFFSA